MLRNLAESEPRACHKYNYSQEDATCVNRCPSCNKIWLRQSQQMSTFRQRKEDFRTAGSLNDRILDATTELVSSEFPLLEGLESVIMTANGSHTRVGNWLKFLD